MNTRTIVVLGLATICGIAAAALTIRLQGSTVSGKTLPIVTAKVDISRGAKLSEDKLEIQQWPGDMVPEKAFTKIEDVLDRVAVVKILKGDTISKVKVAESDSKSGLAAQIPTGKRAYTIQTTKVATNVAGFILPGNHVDIILTLKGNYNDGTGGGSTTTLLQAVEILAIDQRLEAPAENKSDPSQLRSVTLLVTPQQAAQLDLGQNLGQLTLSLRNPEDRDEAITEPATLADLRFQQTPPVVDSVEAPESEAAPRDTMKYRIRTLRGNHPGEISVSTLE